MDEKTLRDELREIRNWARNAPDSESYLSTQITAIWQALFLLADRTDRK